MKSNDKRSNAALLVVAALCLLWPALYNRQPFYFSDTSAYVRGADAAVERITGFSTAWSQKYDPRAAPASDSDGPPAKATGWHESVSSIKDKAVLSGRSVYYGALLYFGRLGGEFWLTIFIQAVLLASALMLTLRTCHCRGWFYFGLVTAVTCITTAPFYASFLMPDIFAALAILAFAVLIVAGRALRRLDYAFWFSLLAFSLLAHSAHVLLIAAMLTIAVATYFIRRQRTAVKGLVAVGLSLVVAILGEAAFSYGVTRMLGAPPIRPPFLMARVIDDGPGYDYLRATCPRSGFVVCRFVDRLPLPSDYFLWRGDPELGVFAASDAKIRRELSQEQLSFFLAVLSYDFWGQISASTRNALRQASLIGLEEFNYPERKRAEFAAKLPPQTYSRMLRAAAYRETMPVHWPSMLSRGLAIAGFLYLVYVSWRATRNAALRSLTSVRIAGFVVLGVVLNAAICGALSAPNHRYQARLVWLLPIIALIIDFERRKEWWRGLLPAGEEQAAPKVQEDARTLSLRCVTSRWCNPRRLVGQALGSLGLARIAALMSGQVHEFLETVLTQAK